jgi:hypothetical protein
MPPRPHPQAAQYPAGEIGIGIELARRIRKGFVDLAPCPDESICLAVDQGFSKF